MTQFASFDSTIAAPAAAPVTGWYDTGAVTYLNLPASANLLVVTQAQWTAQLAGGLWAVASGALVAYTPPVTLPTLLQQASNALNAGLTIASTSSQASNGTYDVSAISQAHLQSELIALLISGNTAFADGTSTVIWPDVTGTNHTFSTTEFAAFAKAAGAYVAALYKVLNGTLSILPLPLVAIA